MAEEHGFQSPKGHRLCVNNCGFSGSSATQNMCSKCYGDVCLQTSGDRHLISKPATSAVPYSSSTEPAAQPIVEVVSLTERVATAGNRCSACRKKVGLTGFRCKCGTTFCGTHRYPEKHGCSFDFKTVGREAIAKANPLVKGEKLHKI